MIFFLLCCKQSDSAGSDAGPEEVLTESITEVTLEHPQRVSMTEYMHLNAVTVYQKKDNIRSNNTGYIVSLNYKIGDRINAGAVFCKILTKEQVALKNISRSDSTLIKFQEPLQVITHGTGIITSVNVVQGDYIAEGDIMATISEPGSLIAEVNVPYEYKQYAHAGTRCQLILPDQHIMEATITGMLPTVDPVSQSQTYFIKLSQALLPENLNIMVRLPYQHSNNALCVHSTAVQTDELHQDFWLMKLVGDRAIRVPVTLGLQNDSLSEVLSGDLSIQDSIINEGAYELADSSLVKIVF